MRWISYIVGILLLGLDQVVKYLVSSKISVGEVKEVVPGVISLTNLRNDGAAWSILSGNQVFFYLITVVALIVLFYLLYTQRQHSIYQWGLILMITGTLGNFIDRIRLKYVVDMFQVDFFNFPIFNVADVCLTVGVLVLFVAIIRDERIEG
ncbi:signal peptidase II [Pediococcus stilesii]|uniref:Lipoprotein signal peptidase n=1 Tax=Pediococcus stilesii TaxID=331679 RepID=A0A0R2L0F9_9LACO|nr:signal peptidase II [Pediococcus stilesii]KRN95150.1 signal peptidase II [Pediococcus stilesii]TLQ04188.1 signal peptidase II [Pediococcus stilesii]